MRGKLGAAALLVVEGVVMGVIEATIAPSWLTLPWLSAIGAVAVAIFLWSSWPSLKVWLDPTEKILRQGEERQRKKEQKRMKELIQAARMNPILGQPTFDPATGTVSAPLVIPQSRWRRLLVKLKIVRRKTLTSTMRTPTKVTQTVDFRKLGDAQRRKPLDDVGGVSV